MRAYLRTILAMTVGFGVLLSFTGPVAAISLESGTAHFERPPAFRRTALARFEGPDGSMFLEVSNHPVFGGVLVPLCYFSHDCRPDESFGVAVDGVIGDRFGFIVSGSQTGPVGLPVCGVGGPPCATFVCGPGHFSDPVCASFGRLDMRWVAGLLPPFGGELETTVPGTFQAEFQVGFLGPLLSQLPSPPPFAFSGTGSALFHFAWNPDTEGWSFQSVDGRIDPVPEPASLLLFGTTAAGLGLAPWYRRRGREQVHAA